MVVERASAVYLSSPLVSPNLQLIAEPVDLPPKLILQAVLDAFPVLNGSPPLKWLTVMVAVVAAVLFFSDPGVTEIDGPLSTNTKIRFFHPGARLAEIICCWFVFMYCGLHMKRFVFLWCFEAFECRVPILACVVGEVLQAYNTFNLARHVSAMTPQLVVTTICSSALEYVPLTVLICTADAIMLTKCLKCTLLAIAMLANAYAYVNHRFFSDRWSDESVCWGFDCGTALSGYLSATIVILAFLAKMLFHTVCGTFAVFRPRYKCVQGAPKVTPP